MSSTFRFVWDGNVLLHETFKKDNSENTELTTWVFEGFVPTAKLVNGKAYSIISDHLGTPILAVDSEGREVWNRQLDIYGRVKREIKASFLGDDVRPFILFLYQGQYYDFETNLAYNRFRYYSPDSGTYISQDPIGLAGGLAFYGYVFDCNGWIDPWGLENVYVVYQAPVLDANGVPTGEIYTGRTKGIGSKDSTEDISRALKKRKSNHHRKDIGSLTPVFVTDNYNAMRGGEHYYIQVEKKAGTAADQINGIADRNFGIDKNGNAKKGNRYMDAFYAENPDLEKLH